jgi:hypothetical protein
MAQQNKPPTSKFAATFAALHRKPEAEEPSELAPVEGSPPATISHAPAGRRGKGRPPGKRSDPDFMNTTVLLRKTTKRTAARLLEDTQSGQDLSELVEQLLTQWIKRKS